MAGGTERTRRALGQMTQDRELSPARSFLPLPSHESRAQTSAEGPRGLTSCQETPSTAGRLTGGHPGPSCMSPHGMEAQGSSCRGTRCFSSHWCPAPGAQHGPAAAAQVAGQRTQAALFEPRFLTRAGSRRPAPSPQVWAQEGRFRAEPQASRLQQPPKP